jgi:hypothetical protein
MVSAPWEDLEAIRQLKYAYFRLLDTKEFDALGALLTEDVTTAFDGGKTALVGRDKVVSYLHEALGNPRILHLHNGHHPEITLVHAKEATGTWYLVDRVILLDLDREISGAALYQDRYVATDGRWQIRHTGYDRIFVEHREHSTGRLLSVSPCA